ncbi:hypothetical protein GCM10009550_24490 [Actinocorallia libanotica]|uniref:Phage derived Gp49-like protein DUF891 n=1 Tax=Actinocorallia libanotica TaxID=46162 RepID=A0ABP4BAB1_9ACTN
MVDVHVGNLAEQSHLLRMPLARPLREGVQELRFTLPPRQVRITYYFAGDTRIVLLTTFCKTRQNERDQVNRAIEVKRICEQSHQPAAHDFSRKG